MDIKKRIALVTSGKQQKRLIDWVSKNAHRLHPHEIYAMGSMAKLITIKTRLRVNRLHSKPLGGYQQLVNMMANGDLDILFLLWDPAASPREDFQVMTLLRLAAMNNVVMTCNEATADFILNSAILEQTYLPVGVDAVGAIELVMAESAYCDAG
ncbi:MAG: methylglyoxal synthase [Pseudomonadota bacterium]